MPIPLPNLDDLTYADLVDEARSMIPVYAPSWTDHNPSDPGIALVELCAWLTEMVLYRTNQLPDKSTWAFLQLLNGQGWTPPENQSLDDAVRSTVKGLRERWRAVTADDYEYLLRTQWPGSPQAEALPAAQRDIRRARCLAKDPVRVGLVLVPGAGLGTSPWLDPPAQLLGAVADFFSERRLITTRLYVTGPRYVRVDIAATLYLKSDARNEDVTAAAKRALDDFFHPLTGGADGKGWPFGRPVHASEVYSILERVRGIDHADDVVFTVGADGSTSSATPAGAAPSGPGAIPEVSLAEHELPLVDVDTAGFTVMERRRGGWAQIEP
jgi:hypothetical protein